MVAWRPLTCAFQPRGTELIKRRVGPRPRDTPAVPAIASLYWNMESGRPEDESNEGKTIPDVQDANATHIIVAYVDKTKLIPQVWLAVDSQVEQTELPDVLLRVNIVSIVCDIHQTTLSSEACRLNIGESQLRILATSPIDSPDLKTPLAISARVPAIDEIGLESFPPRISNESNLPGWTTIHQTDVHYRFMIDIVGAIHKTDANRHPILAAVYGTYLKQCAGKLEEVVVMISVAPVVADADFQQAPWLLVVEAHSHNTKVVTVQPFGNGKMTGFHLEGGSRFLGRSLW